MIVWLNGTHGVGKSTVGRALQPLLPNARILDPEKVGETLMDISPGLPATDNFQHWPPWRPLVVETARRVLDYVGGTLVVPMTVLVEPYWHEISDGLADHDIGVHHVVLHADEQTLRDRIAGAHSVPSAFRLAHLQPYFAAASSWLHAQAAVVVDTRNLTPAQAAAAVATSVPGD